MTTGPSRIKSEDRVELDHRSFYNRVFIDYEYCTYVSPQAHPYFNLVKQFVEENSLRDSLCLEIGCGRGFFQHMVHRYVGTDITRTIGGDNNATAFTKPFIQCDAKWLPFKDNSFDAVWTIDVLEHVPGLETALQEIMRVLKQDGLLLFAPAWHTRSWFANGYPIRPFSDFSLKGKIIKASIPLRDFPLLRYPKILFIHFIRYLSWR